MDYFIADLHDKDENIITYEHRPFKDIQEMHKTIVKNINKKLGKGDTLYLLGDIGDISILEELTCNIVVVVGNHDDIDGIKSKNPQIKIYDHPIMVGNLWLSHEPIGYMPPECPYLNIHGHLHRFNYGLLKRKWKDGNRYFCVSVEQIDYTPISTEEIATLMEYK